MSVENDTKILVAMDFNSQHHRLHTLKTKGHILTSFLIIKNVLYNKKKMVLLRIVQLKVIW